MSQRRDGVGPNGVGARDPRVVLVSLLLCGAMACQETQMGTVEERVSAGADDAGASALDSADSAVVEFSLAELPDLNTAPRVSTEGEVEAICSELEGYRGHSGGRVEHWWEGSLAPALEKARGTAADPLPVSPSMGIEEVSGLCVDGSGGVWVAADVVRAFDAALELRFEGSLPGARVACLDGGAVQVRGYGEAELAELVDCGDACDDAPGVLVEHLTTSGLVSSQAYATDGTLSELLVSDHGTLNLIFAPTKRLVFAGVEHTFGEAGGRGTEQAGASEAEADQAAEADQVAEAEKESVAGRPMVELAADGGVVAARFSESTALDAAGQSWSVHPVPTDRATAALYARRSGEPEFIAERWFDHSARVSISTSEFSVLLNDEVVYVSYPYPAASRFGDGHPLSSGWVNVAALSLSGEPLWTRNFASYWDFGPLKMWPTPGGGVWIAGSFREWVETGEGRAIYGHHAVPPAQVSHQFVASLSAQGEQLALEAMGPSASSSEQLHVAPVDGYRAYVGRRTFGSSEATAGHVPGLVGLLDARGRPTLPPPRQPAEDLQTIELPVDSDLLSVFASVQGVPFAALNVQGALQFQRLTDGERLPPVAVPELPARHRREHRFGLNGDWLVYGSHRDYGAPRTLGLHHLENGAWELQAELDTQPVIARLTDLWLTENWLFVRGDNELEVFRTTDWQHHQSFWNIDAAALSFDRRGRLFVGAPEVSAGVLGRGKVYIFELQAGQWMQTTEIEPPDPEPFIQSTGEPSVFSNYGSWVVGQGNRLVASDPGGRSFLYELEGGQWLLRGRLDGKGMPSVMTDDLIVLGYHGAPRGTSYEGGQVLPYHLQGDQWFPVERIAPYQRWDGNFGDTSVLYDGTLFVADPMARRDPGDIGRGRLYAVDPWKCAGTECWSGWRCPLE